MMPPPRNSPPPSRTSPAPPTPKLRPSRTSSPRPPSRPPSPTTNYDPHSTHSSEAPGTSPKLKICSASRSTSRPAPARTSPPSPTPLSKAYNGNFKALKALDPQLAGIIAKGGDADILFGNLANTFQNQASKQAGTAQGKFKSLSIALNETKESIGAALLPILEKLLPKLQSLGNFVRDNTGLIVTLGLVIGTLATAILAVNAGMAAYNAIQALTAALNTALTASFSALWVATGAVVIIGIIAAIVALQAKFNIFGVAIEGLKTGFNAFWGVVKDVWSKISGAFTTGFSFITSAFGAWYSGVRQYIDAVYSAFKTVFNGVASIWNNTVGKLSFKVPGWVPVIGGKGFDVPDIPMLAEGGIVTGPTLAMIGEAGPEAVIPLDRGGLMGSGTTINVTVTSADPNAVVAALQQYVRLNNRLPANAIG